MTLITEVMASENTTAWPHRDRQIHASCCQQDVYLEADVLPFSIAVKPEHEVGTAHGLLLQVLAHMRLHA